ncbi:hypothetical protein C3V43_08310 [Bacteroides heparinolyticus]|uniref:BACON domain-containing protein n=1 Tax=Prevotella heparinolytica TaxID=28113 RepID=UPI000D0453A4|nr:BACON domain-containing protein [Bacteroides heparinolyticus]AVM57757.1 hypothetical protein C3V43_08310 [Bacteroides heparinolyticus]
MKTLKKRVCEWRYFCIMCCLVNILGSCSKEEIPAEITPTGNSKTYFSKSLDFTSDGGENMITFTSNKDWKIEMSQSGGQTSWCSVSPTEGKAGENTVKIKTTRNTTYDDRNVTLTLTANELTKKIVVTQKQKDALTLTTAKYEIGSEGGTIQIEVKANIDYEVIIPDQHKDWIHKSGNTRSLSASSVSFTIDKSEEYKKREGEIIIKSGMLSETLKIYQAGSAILLLSKNEYAISDKGEQITVELNSNFEYDVQMPQVDWITSVKTRGISSHTLYYVISPNDSYDSREAEIVFYDKYSDKKEKLKITQAQKNAINIPKKIFEFEKDGGVFEVEVASNVKYEIGIDSEWISQKPGTRTLNNDKYSFLVNEMPNGITSRKGTIAFTDKTTGLSAEVVVTQTNLFYLNKNTLELLENRNEKLLLTNLLSNKNVTWKSSNSSIAKVNEDGTVIAVSKGEAIITVSSTDGKHKTDCLVSVKNITNYISVWTGSSAIMSVNGFITGSVTVYLQNNSPVSIKLKKIQLIASDNSDVNTNVTINEEEISSTQNTGYTISIKIGIYKPVIRWVYEYNGKEYYADIAAETWG